jgi:predicted transcriptional regulator
MIAYMALSFEKKVKRDTAVTLRLKAETVKKLREVAEKYGVSQADVMEKLIEMAHSDLPKRK